MGTTFQRLLAAATLTAAAVVLPVVTATSAQATPAQCESYLRNAGYVVGPKVKAACRKGAQVPTGHTVCLGGLVSIGVQTAHANRACTLAA
ncbi:hypothetical protein ACFY8W_28980 [Streptomyces sp. NPDC012637]|uniref:hypothetical protein n=1 Tax=Streptomyces sp. NPDC012637 TaxID=3364842 RepID=UPI0036E16167